MWLVLIPLAFADIGPPRTAPAPCAPANRCHGQEQLVCAERSGAERCPPAHAEGWRFVCHPARSALLYCRNVAPSPVLPDPPADVVAALGPGAPRRVRLVGAVEARARPEDSPIPLGPFPAAGSDPWPALEDGGGVRVVVGGEVRALASVPPSALLPVLTVDVDAVAPDGSGAGVRLHPGARLARLTTDGADGTPIRALGPIEVDTTVAGSAIGVAYAPAAPAAPGDRCAAVGAVLRGADGGPIAQIVGDGPCVPGFRLVEAAGDRVLVELSTDEVTARGWLAEAEVTLPIPGLRGLGGFGGGGTGGGGVAVVRRSLPPATYLYDAPDGQVIGRSDTAFSVRAVEARSDGWWRLEAPVGGATLVAWAPPDGARWASPPPVRAVGGRAATSVGADGGAGAVDAPTPDVVEAAASPRAGCGCAATPVGGAPAVAVLLGLVGLSRRGRRGERRRER